MILDLSFIILAYIIGSLSSAILLSRYFKLPDPREHGSKNAGATNVLRTGHKLAATLVLVGDALKGVITVVLARLCGVEAIALSLVAAACVIGHMYPVFFQFKGGKGVATALGALLALYFPLAFVLILVWGLCLAITRYVSLASVVCAACSIIFSLSLSPFPYEFGVIMIATLIVFRHKENILRLIDGKETKISFKKSSS